MPTPHKNPRLDSGITARTEKHARLVKAIKAQDPRAIASILRGPGNLTPFKTMHCPTTGFTPLHLAAQGASFDIFETILRSASFKHLFFAKARSGHSPLDLLLNNRVMPAFALNRFLSQLPEKVDSYNRNTPSYAGPRITLNKSLLAKLELTQEQLVRNQLDAYCHHSTPM